MTRDAGPPSPPVVIVDPFAGFARNRVRSLLAALPLVALACACPPPEGDPLPSPPPLRRRDYAACAAFPRRDVPRTPRVEADQARLDAAEAKRARRRARDERNEARRVAGMARAQGDTQE